MQPKLSLMAYFGMVPVSQVLEKPVFRSPYIRFMRFLLVSKYLYEIGAIIGRARHNKLLILVKMLAVPGKEHNVVSFLQEQAQKRLDSYGREPDTFFSLFMTTELAKMGCKLEWFEVPRKVAEQKMPLQEAEPIIKLLGEEGIGFGSKFPELTQRMFSHQYERIDMGQWREMKKYVTTFSGHPPQITLEEREQEVLSQLAVYVNEYFPQLVRPLALKID